MELPAFTDHYTTLGLRRTATASEIRRAYRRLVLRHHPDRNPPEADAVRTFQKITEAYEVLSDPEKRGAYDDLLSSYLKAPVVPKTLQKAPASKVQLRLSYLSAQNPMLFKDARRGAWISAAVFPLLVSNTDFIPTDLPSWQLPLLSFLFGAMAWIGWLVGDAARGVLQGLAEFLFRIPEIGDAIRAAAPFLLAGIAPWTAAYGLRSYLYDFPLTGLFPAVLGGASAGWVGAAFGRAFSFADAEPRRAQGIVAGVLCGASIGALIGFLFTAATSDVLAGARFFSLWSCSGGAALAGASLAAIFGAVQLPETFDQEP